MEFESLTIQEIEVGMQVIKEISLEENVGKMFAEISDDYNPIHIDEAFAQKSIFKNKIAHGMLIGSYISGIIGTRLPGIGTIYAKQEILFRKPVFYNQKIKILVEVVEVYEDKNRVLLKTQCFDENSNLLVDGTAVVLPRKD